MIHHRMRTLASAAVALWLAVGLVAQGCSSRKPPVAVSRYPTLPPKKVPDFLKDTIFEKTDLLNTEPFVVSGFGLVANLNGTGSSDVSNAVRDYMIKEMQKHKFGSDLLRGMKDVPPERVLRDPRFAIVRVDGYMPPGIREGETFDVNVSAVPESSTTSLAGGDLYQTDLRINGANPMNPGGSVNLWARCEGPLFVNPAYAMNRDPSDSTVQRSLRRAVVMDGGRAAQTRPLILQLRAPQRSLARRIESRVDERFQEIRTSQGLALQDDAVAAARDEGRVNLYVPPSFNGDWERFANIVTHLYLKNSPEFAAAKAKQLADEAVKPGAPLWDITYCWEGLGRAALPSFQHLMDHPAEDVAFVAARAAAFLEDPAAPAALNRIARTPGHTFQVDAIQVLGALPNSPAINEMLRPLLHSDQTLVRVAAYEILARHKDGSIFSKVIGDGRKEKFVLDIVRSDGPPLVHATRTGIPRIAIFGEQTSLSRPLAFATKDTRLTISSSADNPFVTIFYRPPMPPGGVSSKQAMDKLRPVKIESRPDLAEVVVRLGGQASDGRANGLTFNYGDVVSILNALADAQKLFAVADGQRRAAAFVLQEAPTITDAIQGAPSIPDAGRPQSDDGRKVGLAN
jgi:hypothetical protein